MYYFWGALLAVFAVYGLAQIVYAIYKRVMRCGAECRYVLLTVHESGAEEAVRSVLRDNPGSEVIVVNKSHSCDTPDILKRLEKDFPQLHIV